MLTSSNLIDGALPKKKQAKEILVQEVEGERAKPPLSPQIHALLLGCYL